MTDIAIERAGARDPRDDGARENGAGRDAETRASAARAAQQEEHRRAAGIDPLFGVRTADIEPYTGLRYLSKLFRMIAVVLVLLLVAEVVTGVVRDGAEALTTLLAEVSRLIVLAGLLWGAGDLAILLIDVGHDVRAARILISRQTAHLAQHDAPGPVPRAAGRPGAGPGVPPGTTPPTAGTPPRA
jgi:hypothetical protein